MLVAIEMILTFLLDRSRPLPSSVRLYFLFEQRISEVMYIDNITSVVLWVDHEYLEKEGV